MSFDPVWMNWYARRGGGASGGTSSAVEEKDINFIDYDGTLLYSYTVEEAAALTELPALPTQKGLICQGWNWSLEDIQALGRAVTVGAMYITDDGKTRLYIHLEEGRTSPMVGVCPNGTVTVDWGDGTDPDTLTGTSTSNVQWTPNHEYAAPGDYVITLAVDGEMSFWGKNASYEYSGTLRYSSSADKRNIAYRSALEKVEIGSGVIGFYTAAFSYCYNLKSVAMPNDISSFFGYTFQHCYSLKHINFPNVAGRLGGTMGSTFDYCYSLASVSVGARTTDFSSNFRGCASLNRIIIHDGVTSLGGGIAFFECQSLTKIIFPKTLMYIPGQTFQGCYGMKFYDFTKHTAVPTLAATNAFTGIAADCEIRVPAALYDEWIAATNWATYADYIVGV